LAANKRKILENARKLAQKGAKDKALREYQRLVQLDPRDAKLRLEIGDAYRRWGQVEEAIDTYSKVADQYMKEGFDARAVAVYKQILNLDPERNASYEPLAELYERMGLTSEAINALQTAADGYHREGKKREALELLRKMATIDPSNTTSRIKVAELLRQEGMLAESVLEYEEVAQELARQGDSEAEGKVYRRILEIEPERASALTAFARNLVKQNMASEAESVAKRALAGDGEEPENYELLAEIYRSQGREDALPEIYRPLAELYRRRGDEDRAREIQQRFVPAALDASEVGGPDTDADLRLPRDIPGEAAGALDPEDELSIPGGFDEGGDEGEELELGPELELDADDALDFDPPLDSRERASPSEPLESAPLSAKGADDSPEQPAGDPDQLLAEASVYLRYGKRDRAIAHLQAVLGQEPGHRPALEKLGEACAEDGDTERAVEYWLIAAKRAREDSDLDAVAVLRGRIDALDPAAAATLAEPARQPEPESETEIEILHGTEDGGDHAPAAGLDADLDLDLDLDDEEDADLEDEEQGIDLEDDEEDIDLEDDDEQDDGEGIDVEEIPEAPAAAVAASESSHPSASLSTTTAQQILEELEEADFYMDQGLLDEADAIYKRVLAIAPNHPRALVRLGEVAAARGEDPGSGGPVGGVPEPAAAEAASDEVAPQAMSPDRSPEAAAIESPEVDLYLSEDNPLELSGELAAEADDLDPVVDVDTDVDGVPDEEVAPEDETGEVSMPTESFRPQPAAAPADADVGFDLAIRPPAPAGKTTASRPCSTPSSAACPRRCRKRTTRRTTTSESPTRRWACSTMRFRSSAQRWCTRREWWSACI
jgi:tetratricopeptide (TPR) repeat protein